MNNELKLAYRHKILNCINSIKTTEHYFACRRLCLFYRNKFFKNDKTLIIEQDWYILRGLTDIKLAQLSCKVKKKK